MCIRDRARRFKEKNGTIICRELLHLDKGIYEATPEVRSTEYYKLSLIHIWERTGNCPLEAMAMEYAQLIGNDGGMRLEVITEIADYFQKEIGYKIDPKTPFVGSDFNSTRAGIHADGILKDEEIYNIFDTKKILNRPVGVMLGEHSGVASIAYWINTHFNLPQELCVDKRSELVEKVRQIMDGSYAEGRNTMFSDAELEAMVEAADAEQYRKFKENC